MTCAHTRGSRFETADAEFFFGREQVVAEAVGHLIEQVPRLRRRLGEQQSSLLRAGASARTRVGCHPRRDRWAYAVRPGDHPRRDGSCDGRAGGGGAPCARRRSVRGGLHRAPDGPNEPRSSTPSRTPRGADGASIVMAMRADFYGRCAEHRALASLLASDQILVGPMDREELRRAIELPAERAGLTVDEEARRLARVGHGRSAGWLPLLSTAPTRALDQPSGPNPLDGRLPARRRCRGAVARSAEEAFGRLDRDEQAAGSGSCSASLRRAKPRRSCVAELRSQVRSRTRPDASHALNVLIDARLVTVSDGTAEVAHRRYSMNGLGSGPGSTTMRGAQLPSDPHGVVARVGRGRA